MSATLLRPGDASARLGRRRQRTDKVVTALAVGCTAIGLFFLASILFTLIWRGLGAMDLRVFTEVTRPPGSNGGLLNAIVGTLIQVSIGTLIGTPVGILVGTYLAEYARGSRLGGAVRFVSDILLSAPSILVGLFVYQIMVLPFGHFSGLAGAVALAIIIIPIVVRTTEDMLQLIPDTLREAVMGLGAPKWKMITLICYRSVLSGLITGVLLGIARIAGETAPLLFTALNNQYFTSSMSEPMANIPVVIFQFALAPYDAWHSLAWAGALLMTLFVLVISVGARFLLRTRVS